MCQTVVIPASFQNQVRFRTTYPQIINIRQSNTKNLVRRMQRTSSTCCLVLCTQKRLKSGYFSGCTVQRGTLSVQALSKDSSLLRLHVLLKIKVRGLLHPTSRSSEGPSVAFRGTYCPQESGCFLMFQTADSPHNFRKCVPVYTGLFEMFVGGYNNLSYTIHLRQE